MKTLSILTTAALLATIGAGAQAETFVLLDSKAAYLHTNNESPPAPAALALDFRAYGYAVGDTIHLQSSGLYDNGPNGETFWNISAIFSSDGTLLAPTLLNRVPGAIASNAPAYVTSPTYWGAQATDIAFDFQVDQTGVDVTIPVGATLLFIAAHDSWYQDNSDSNHDFGFLIGAAPVPEPRVWALLLAGLGVVGKLAGGGNARQRRGRPGFRR